MILYAAVMALASTLPISYDQPRFEIAQDNAPIDKPFDPKEHYQTPPLDAILEKDTIRIMLEEGQKKKFVSPSPE